MSQFNDLLAAKRAADEALADFEATLIAELVQAKDAHRKSPTDTTRQAKAAAVANIQAHRALLRATRTDLVGGDAFVSPEQNEG
jgi:DNA-binding FadR family transcriptional regulator